MNGTSSSRTWLSLARPTRKRNGETARFFSVVYPVSRGCFSFAQAFLIVPFSSILISVKRLVYKSPEKAAQHTFGRRQPDTMVPTDLNLTRLTNKHSSILDTCFMFTDSYIGVVLSTVGTRRFLVCCHVYTIYFY